MTWYFILKYLHVLGAIVLIGTGAGIAFFMVRAHLDGDARVIASTARSVVFGDFVFTATAVIAQPATGYLLVREAGYSLTDFWIFWSLLLYALIGLFWLPVVWMQMKLAEIANLAVRENTELPQRYYRIFWLWFAFGFPAFGSILVILWLMIARPS